MSDARLCVKTRCCTYIEERWRECLEEETGLVCMQIAVLSSESISAVYEGERRGAIMPKIPELSVGNQIERSFKWYTRERSLLARFDRKISFHFTRLDPLVSDRSLWHNGKHRRFGTVCREAGAGRESGKCASMSRLERAVRCCYPLWRGVGSECVFAERWCVGVGLALMQWNQNRFYRPHV